MYRNVAGRSFQNMEDTITGKSVVIDNNLGVEDTNFIPDNPWPYSLTDYLQNFIGKLIEVTYLITNGKCCNIKGKLIITGSNFIGIQPSSADTLFMIELGTIKSVNIANYNKNLKI